MFRVGLCRLQPFAESKITSMSNFDSEGTSPENPVDSFRHSLAHRRIAILTDGYSTPFLAKTAINLLRYRTHDVAAVLDRQSAGTTAQTLLGAGGGIPVAAELSDVSDADALYIGIAPPGGKLPDEWQPVILAALERRMDVVSGLHDFLTDNPTYTQAAAESGARLIDVRRNRHKVTGSGYRFQPECVRIHTVGHDCSVGKMVVAVELERALKTAGYDAKFLATGQTGIMISGEGVPIDCVVADFVNGAAEQLVRGSEQHEFVLIEGQGSVTHPAFSAVTLGLLHGAAPDGLIFCYEAGRTQVKGLDNVDIPPLRQQMKAFELLAELRHPCRIIAVAVNTRTLPEDAALAEIERAEREFGLPACDVYRTGCDKLVRAATELRRNVVPA